MRRLLLCSMILAVLGAARGALAAAPADDVPPPPPLPRQSAPAAGADDETLQPEITITTRNGEKYEEYRVNGRLYQIKVTPRIGPPYYLVFDEQGRSRRSELEPDIVPPAWVIKRF